ncbi:substrate-binding periplasmic protein [Thalassospira australica]|uniref:substrate-binding periplasmic protein n=1 Tax=Thalassospira australica TaxID=1528106 RepID=UPI00051A0C89|nr:transporter substrate-binding domain-containing protein [Thalassospira australica]
MQDYPSKVVLGPVLAGLIAYVAGFLPGVSSAGDITVMTTPFPPYVVYQEDTDQASGPAVDIVHRICEEAELTCLLRVEPWARAYETAKRMPNTLIFSIARRPDREEQFQWIGTVAPYHVRLFSLDGYDVPEVESWRRLQAFHVAGQMRDVKAQYLENAGFDVVKAPSAEATIRMLYAGRAELVAGDSLSLPYRAKALAVDDMRLKVVAEVPELSTELYLAASLTTDEIVVRSLRNALDALKRRGDYDRIWAIGGFVSSN